MLKNEKRPGYNKTKVGWIPEGWNDSRLTEICSMKSGESITAQSISEKGIYPCFGGNGLRGFTLTFTHDGNFVLIGRQGALCGNVHRVSGKFYASEHAVVATPHENTNPIWLAETLSFKKLNRHSESSAQPGLSVLKILKMRVPLPPLPEQEAIAEVLECWDGVIRTLEVKIGKRRLVKQGLMQKLLSGRIRLPGFSKPWKYVGLGNILSIGNGKDYKHLAKGTVPVFGTGGLMTYVNDKLHSGETVFIGRKGTINKPFYFNGDFWNVDTLFFTHNFKNVLPKFVFFLFQRINWEKHSEASGVPSLSKTVILKLKVHIPPLEEQRAIEKVLSVAMREIEALERKLALFKDQKMFLLNNLVTGTIRLPQFCNHGKHRKARK